MARKHYHVFCGLRGCMPESNEIHTSRRSAERDAAWCADEARQDGESVHGNAQVGFYTVGDYRYIEIAPCTESSCLEDANA